MFELTQLILAYNVVLMVLGEAESPWAMLFLLISVLRGDDDLKVGGAKV